MKRYHDTQAVLVAAVAILAYVNNLGNGFTYDDRFIIEHNPLVQNLDWWALATSSYWGDIVTAGLYRPLTLLSFGVNRALGSGAFGFHLTNNLLHAGASVLVLVAARCLGSSRFVALAAALVFALHPLQTEAVDSIVGRAEILALVFVLGAFIVFVRRRNPLGVAGLFFLALCSKESAAFAASLFVFYWLFFERRNLAPVAAAIVAYAGLRIAILGGFGIGGREIGFLDNPLASASLGSRVGGAPILLAEYGKLVVWPATLSADYSYNQIALTPDVRVVAGLAIGFGLLAIAWNRRGLPGFAALAFVVPLAGVLQILFPLGTLFAERLTYLPMFGASLLIALALSVLPRRAWVLGVLLAVCAVRVVSRNPDWRDNEALFRRTVQTAPNSARTHFLLGAELLEQQNYQEAASSFAAGLRIAPQHVGARMSRGEALLAAGEPDQALTEFSAALERTPSDEIRARAVAAALAAGRQRGRNADWIGAHTAFARAQELDPASADAANSLGLVSERRGDLGAAEALYREALDNDPDFHPAILNLASIQMNQGRLVEAEASFRRAVLLAPQSYEAYNGLGIALARQGLEERAEAAFRTALEIDPTLEAARDNLRALGKTP